MTQELESPRRIGDVDVMVPVPPALLKRLLRVCEATGEEIGDVICDVIAFHLDEIDLAHAPDLAEIAAALRDMRLYPLDDAEAQ